MPLYLFEDKKTGEIREVIQRMSEPHIYKAKGRWWARVFVNPQVSIDVKIDPFSQKEFTQKTATKKGVTIGQMMDYSAELSEKRARVAGEDPIKAKVIDNYERRTHKKHPSKIPKSIEIDLHKKSIKPMF